MIPRSRIRFPLMALAMFALLAAVWGGLVRLGWPLPPLQPTLLSMHGPLMVSGFLGTLISLERAVALHRRWYYIAPLVTGLGTLTLIAGGTGGPGPLLMTLGSLGLVIICMVIIRRQPALFTMIMGLGALTWLVGNGLWLGGRPIYSVVLWWAGFLILTIAAERLELARIVRLSTRLRMAFLGSTGLLVLGCALAVVVPSVGWRLAGIGMLALAWWLLRYDIARRTVRKPGVTRFIALCLLLGYVWLGVGGILALVHGGVTAGPSYDAVLHAIFLGFTLSMIFGHAPIIFPALLDVPLSFHPTFYAHLGLLHVSLLVRVLGDLVSWWPGRRWGGLLNVIALLLFLAITGYSVRRAATQHLTAESRR